MAPTIGPKEAPMMPKTAGSFAAHFASAGEPKGIIAISILTMEPIPTEIKGFTLGMVVLKLLGAMNDEKQAPGNEASVRPIMIAAKSPPLSFFSKADVILTTVGSITPEA